MTALAFRRDNTGRVHLCDPLLPGTDGSLLTCRGMEPTRGERIAAAAELARRRAQVPLFAKGAA